MNTKPTTATMLLALAIATCFALTSTHLHSQTVLAQPLPQLGWLPAPNPSFTAERALGVDFDFRDCAD